MERGARATTRSGIRDILGQGVGNHYGRGSGDIFSMPLVPVSSFRFLVVKRPTGRSYIYIYFFFLFLEVLYEARAPAGGKRA